MSGLGLRLSVWFGIETECLGGFILLCSSFKHTVLGTSGQKDDCGML